MSQPFFTIGIPTYNRHDMLKDALASVLVQSFPDFEIIVGNDYPAEELTCEMLGISDQRIRIVNQSRNLREVGNMNALLAMATGRYFTWLFDDDLYEPDFLQRAHDCFVKTGFPPALFPSFRMLKPTEKFQPKTHENSIITEFSGREFLLWYSAERPQIASTSGLFDTAVLKLLVGGVEELCASAIGIHCEYLFLVKCALLKRVVYMNSPFYVFRRHTDSASESSVDLQNHSVAGQELLFRCGEVLRHPTLINDFSENLLKLCKIHIITFAYVISRFEFAQAKFGVGTVCRAISRHWQESSNIRKVYVHQGGSNRLSTRLAFQKTSLFCYYLFARHFACFYYRSIRK